MLYFLYRLLTAFSVLLKIKLTTCTQHDPAQPSQLNVVVIVMLVGVEVGK